MRVGGGDPIPVDLRIIAASNVPPEKAIQEGKLRQDLYYRLNVFPIHLPPLRQREGDVLVLAEHFLDQLNASEGSDKRLSHAARARLEVYPWPGNVRELKNEIQRAFILSEDVVDFEGLVVSPAPVQSSDGPIQTLRIGTSLSDAERLLILSTLDYCGGDKKKAAAILGISLKTLYNRLNLYAAV
jgi:transcriptional regulator with PAS, ATPase and Fis domain